jgi:hypothetical protein
MANKCVLSEWNVFFVWSRISELTRARRKPLYISAIFLLFRSPNNWKPFHLVAMETPSVLTPHPGPSDLLLHLQRMTTVNTTWWHDLRSINRLLSGLRICSVYGLRCGAQPNGAIGFAKLGILWADLQNYKKCALILCMEIVAISIIIIITIIIF